MVRVLNRFLRLLLGIVLTLAFPIGLVIFVGFFSVVRPFAPSTIKEASGKRLIVGLALRYYLKLATLCRIIKIEIYGLEHLIGTSRTLIIANHPSLLDALVLVSQFPFLTCISKGALSKGLFWGKLLRALGHIDGGNGQTVIEQSVQLLESDGVLLVFPEATRSPLGGLHRFSRVAARIALKTNASIVKVVFTYHPPFMTSGSSIGFRGGVFGLLKGRIKISLIINPPERFDTPKPDDFYSNRMLERRITSDWQTFFTKQIAESSQLT